MVAQNGAGVAHFGAEPMGDGALTRRERRGDWVRTVKNGGLWLALASDGMMMRLSRGWVPVGGVASAPSLSWRHGAGEQPSTG